MWPLRRAATRFVDHRPALTPAPPIARFVQRHLAGATQHLHMRAAREWIWKAMAGGRLSV
jgi:hypothetical protein